MGETLLKVKDLKVNFRIKKKMITAIDDINFEIEKGKTLCVVGESGCGKSVTANTILQLLPKEVSEIEKGEINLEHQNLLKLSSNEIRNIRGNKISMIFQDPMTALNPVYTVGKQLVEMIRAHEKMTKEEAKKKCIEMLGKVGIPEPEHRFKEYPHQLSGGMRQRIMIAMALLTNPELLIADEPTTALDVTIQAQILELMQELKEKYNTAIMLITHDMGVVAEMADKVIVMYAGKIVEKADVTELFKNPLHPYTKDLLKSIPRLDRNIQKLYSIEGVVPSLTNMPSGCRFSTRCKQCMNICREKEPGLIKIENREVRCFKYSDLSGGDFGDE